jgi:hypothetical protein
VRFQGKEGSITFNWRDGDYITVVCPVCCKPITTNL